MSSPRIVLFVSLFAAACASQRPCPVCPVCPQGPTQVRRAEPPPSRVAARPPRPTPPPTPPAPAASPIGGELPAVAISNIESAGAPTCPPACTFDVETKHLYDDARAETSSVEGATSPPPAIASFAIVRPGATLAIGRHDRVDLLGVVVSGRASVALFESGRSRQTLEPWTAFYLADGGLTVQSADDAPVALALVRATDVPHALHSLPSTTARRRTRGGLVVRPIAEIPDLAWAGGAFHARITFEEADSPFASLGVLIGSRDAPVAEHAHPDSWELLSAAVASGALRVPGQPVPGGEEGARVAEHDRAVSDGSVVLVPPGVRHAWQPGRIQPLVAVQAYSPPGPEQRFRALAGATSQ